MWENASPTSDFEPQYITLDLSQYDAVEIDIKLNTEVYNNQTLKCNTRVEKEEREAWNEIGYINLNTNSDTVTAIVRNIQWSDTSIRFGSGGYKTISTGAWTSKARFVIPLRVYGITKI